jgi:hypothetical protein
MASFNTVRASNVSSATATLQITDDLPNGPYGLTDGMGFKVFVSGSGTFADVKQVLEKPFAQSMWTSVTAQAPLGMKAQSDVGVQITIVGLTYKGGPLPVDQPLKGMATGDQVVFTFQQQICFSRRRCTLL